MGPRPFQSNLGKSSSRDEYLKIVPFGILGYIAGNVSVAFKELNDRLYLNGVFAVSVGA